jgi:dynein heavy chain, axonemal
MSASSRTLSPSRSGRPAGGEPNPSSLARVRERGVYSDAVNAELEFDSVKLGRARDGALPVPSLDFDSSRAEFEPDLASSTAVQKDGFPESAVNPKVQVSYSPRPGKTPREIAVRRKRRQYQSQSVTALLEERGVDYTLGNPASKQFDLERFDDEEYEVRSAQAWLSLGEVDGQMMGLPGVGMRLGDAGAEIGEWLPCRVAGFDAAAQRWAVEWNGTGERESLPRVHLMFAAEDPVNFADRVATAHRRRNEAIENMRYSMFIDCMPSDELPQWDTEQSNRVLAQVLNTNKMKRYSHDTAALFQEVNTSFLRALNKMAFDRRLQDQRSGGAGGASGGASSAAAEGCGPMLESVALPPPPPSPPPPPPKGTVAIPAHNFAENFSNVCFHSLLTKDEIIRAMKGLRWECNKVLDLRVFKCGITKALSLADFEQLEETAVRNCMQYLRDTWCASVKNIIGAELRDAGKGWFHLGETDYQVYNLGKLKSFLSYCNLVMKDSLRFMLDESLHEFTEFLEAACAVEVEVASTNEVKVVRVPPALPTASSLFSIDLVVEGEAAQSVFAYSTPPERFGELCVRLFNSSLSGTQNLARIDRLVLDHPKQKNFWGNSKPCLHSVSPVEPWVVNCGERIEKALAEAIAPMATYLETFDSHLPFLRVVVEHYLAEIEYKFAGGPKPKRAPVAATTESGEGDEEPAANASGSDDDEEESALDAAALANLYKDHLAKREALLAAIPKKMQLGLFVVSVADTRDALAEKHEQIAELVLDLLARKVTEGTTAINTHFEEIDRQLAQHPQDIEELTALKEFMDTVPAKVVEHQVVMDTVMENFALLDGLNCKLAPEDFKSRWSMFGWPLKTDARMMDVTDMLEQEKKGYSKNMEGEQEAFVEQLKTLESEVAGLFKFKDLSKAAQVVPHIAALKKELADCVAQAGLFNTREGLFEKEITEYAQVSNITRNFEPYLNLWEGVDKWTQWYDTWLSSPLLSLDAEQIEKDATAVGRGLLKTTRYFSSRNEGGTLDGCLAIATQMSAKIEDFRPHVPMMISMCHPGMRDRHWEQISAKINKTVHPTATEYTLQQVFDDKLEQYEEDIVKIGEVAIKEFNIEMALDKMEEEWAGVNLDLKPYRETGTSVLGGFDEYMALLDEQITMTQAMQFSAFKGPFEERIEEWNDTLMVVSEVLDEWIQVQRNWLYLQPIFDSDDINKQLPVEGKRFSTVDKMWRTTMINATAKPQAVKFCHNKKLLSKFKESNKLLELVQKGLADYLETKRAAFARFYFLSNDELLEILSETKDPTNVQGHLGKCFEGIHRVDFEEDLMISAMNSSDKEKIHFVEMVNPVNREVEKWMTELNEQMVASVRDQMWQALQDYPVTARTEWMLKWPAQVVINGSQVFWTSETEQFIDKSGNDGLGEYFDQCVGQIKDMVMLIRGGLDKAGRTKVGALAVIDVHARDTMQSMHENGVDNTQHFDWVSQMRFYWEPHEVTKVPEDGDLKVVMVRSIRPYGYEYLGNSMRLVITPLTDKCYLTLMGALQMILGGAPAGPAGTGKTETTKDLAKALAKQCVVFNCSDGLDYQAMGKFFKGLAISGAWACFDEFNRINIEVLSVIAQQIITLQGAVLSKTFDVEFEGTMIKVNGQFAAYITMNPGYAGRTELPDNLSALFRPVAMMVPDYGLIGEIMLFAFGYLDGRACAKKMVSTFKLCSEQLSAQSHYDYGMRAVKTVIVAAGNLKMADPDQVEQKLLYRALQDVNVPKFLAHDLPLFAGILSDLFPGISRPYFDYGTLLTSIKLSAERQGRLPTTYFTTKCIELYEMICVRHGLMIVGPAGGGKSSNYKCLQAALTRLNEKSIEGIKYEKVLVYHLNPKSITLGQLYGAFDPNTHEWEDGILPVMIRMCIKSMTVDLKWMYFDGPVDAIWIESMNTVLDDNKKLCLLSGEIITLSPEMTMMFEPEDLEVASPATVSRCGMIYMEPHSLGYDCLLDTWFARLADKILATTKMQLQVLFDTWLATTINMLRRVCKEPMESMDNNLIGSLLRILDCTFDEYRDIDGVEPKTAAEVASLDETIEGRFMFAMIWSLCCTVDTKGRQSFDAFVRAEMRQRGSHIAFPDKGQVYDYCFSEETKGWVKWMDTVEPYKFDPKAPYSELIIPTMDSVRYTHFLDLLVTNNNHVLMVGDTGTGKTVNVARKLGHGMPDKFIPFPMAFSAQTGANQLQDNIDIKLDKRRKGVFGPPLGKKFVLFVDDMNMPMKQEYGAQPPIELLRQWFDSEGWYDRKALEFRKIIDILMVCACGPPGGGRQSVTNRFVHHFNMITYTPMLDESMHVIFETILSGFLAQGFSEQVQELTHDTVTATIGVFNTILKDLRPTPAKSHYTYNLRDLSKVFGGLLMCSKNRVATKTDFLKLWVHECRRQFADRLINDQDTGWFDALLQTQMKDHFSTEWDDVITNPRLFFGDYMIPGAEPRVYEEVQKLDDLIPTVEEYLNEYNQDTKTPMKLIMFMDAVEHVSRISRVLRQSQGNALLLGVGGSGRQSLCRLSTSMLEFELYQVEIAKGYGPNEWHENLKECLMMAGVENKPVVFLFNDTQVVFESMLEDINGILNSGDVPDLYHAEEMDAITSTCKIDCVKAKVVPTKMNIFSAYLKRVRTNIHVVMCMSPIGEAFRTRLRMFPSFVNCCTIDWFTEWPPEALQTVAMAQMTETDLKLGDNLESVVTFIRAVHTSASAKTKEFLEVMRRHNYVTPTSFLELLTTYKKLLEQKRLEVGTSKTRLQVGLDKIMSTQKQVGQLQIDLVALEPVLKTTQAEVDAMIIQITADKEAAGETKEIVNGEEAAAAEKATNTKAIADDAQRDLDEALPALDAAVKCLNKLKKADIDEVKSFANPPGGVRLTMEVMCHMFIVKPTKKNDPDNPGKKIDDFYDAAKKSIINDAKVLLDRLFNFDKDNIPHSVIAKIEPYMSRDDFTPEAIAKASKACTALCMWCCAMYKYHTVALMVEPKKKLLAEATASLAETMAKLQDAQGRLKAVEDRIAGLEANFNAANSKKEQLVSDVEQCRARLERAEKLISGLGGERDRWTDSVAQLTIDYDNLVGDALISAGTIAYAGAFTPKFRVSLVTDWQEQLAVLKIPLTPGCDLASVMGNPVEVRSWNIAGLPADSHSVQNGIVMSTARRWPLLMDPQGQANRFIKNMGKDTSFSENGIDVTKLSEKNFLRTLENGVRFGKWVLLENIGEALDAALEPLLLQQKFIQGGTEMIKVGDSTIPYNNAFRFFMTTKLPNPHYPPEVCVKVSLINFTITQPGLEDQLLGVAIVTELPEMEAKKNALVVSNAAMKKQLHEIESKILKLLSESTGNILDDHVLIETLSASKITSNDINIKVAEAQKTEMEIDTTRETYRPVAVRASILYFAIATLLTVDPMYQYSLPWFTNLFIFSIQNSEQSEDLDTRLTTLNNYFSYHLYKNICRSLFEKDKLLFSFVMAIRILEHDGSVDPAEWMFLISGNGSSAKESKTFDNPDTDWIDQRTWGEALALDTLAAFDGFADDFAQDPAAFRAMFDHPEPQDTILPGRWETQLTDRLQRMCVLRVLRPDTMTLGLQGYVVEKLGQRFVEPPPFNLDECYEDASVTVPLIFVLTQGSDPTKQFMGFADQMKMGRKLNSLSLGQGQGPKAVRMMADGIESGKWVYLQNCHLFISWMVTLERLVEEIDLEQTHKDFRLWLTSMPSKAFPVSVLQNGIKMTNEPPKGLRANLRNAYFKLSDAQLNITTKPFEYKKLLWGLAVFHAVAQERRQFGPLGWNIPYGFNDTDYDISKDQLEMFLDEYEEVPYKVLHFLTSYINYGGRVTDAIDLRTIDVILQQFFQPDTMKDGFDFDGLPIVSVAFDDENPHKSYMDYIEALPINAGPSVFGMHANAAIATGMQETFNTFHTILSLQASSGGSGGGESSEIVVGRMAAGIEERIPPLYVIEEIRMQYPIVYEESMNTVLGQECIRFNSLLAEMHITLPAVQKALKGLVVMSGDLEAMAHAMFVNSVPSNWENCAYPSMKPLGSWVDELVDRTNFISTWIRNNVPPVVWVSGFYFPQAFFTGVTQNFARKHQLPIDTIDFDFL